MDKEIKQILVDLAPELSEAKVNLLKQTLLRYFHYISNDEIQEVPTVQSINKNVAKRRLKVRLSAVNQDY